MRNARRLGGSQGPKSCASLSLGAGNRVLEAAIAQALTPQPGEANQELEARRDLLAQARVLYSTTWLANAARCTVRRAQQILAQRLVWLARCGDMWGFDDLPELRERALRLAQQQAKAAPSVVARQQPLQLQLCLFDGDGV
ncbi:hypothetical protein THIX_70137 [Thiomonas sp. X19]|uniref:hypothetical protein n=1 Tax=Thiomonas sp. X19 TaxID=1050370 RepID=UPI000B73A54F|nr:hypothetical protein [Thiomonas sp. X19]SCC95108.1 hypothetical protein THIX_70137 [Thiomonas sp. X19]